MHLRHALERQGVDGRNAHQPGTESNRLQSAGLDLLVDLFSADQPILGQLVCRHKRPRVHLETLDRRLGRRHGLEPLRMVKQHRCLAEIESTTENQGLSLAQTPTTTNSPKVP